ncbi:hypothetical protein F5146DRAFT_1229313 [Armillaria mellea]|nr:hypothetical protein F5146DRAFT_1229311 [Armillaria mellea]KAK0183812.1 hypothetical protein F5146DRAFT_1229313 [Armillaria mellea]
MVHKHINISCFFPPVTAILDNPTAVALAAPIFVVGHRLGIIHFESNAVLTSLCRAYKYIRQTLLQSMIALPATSAGAKVMQDPGFHSS